jgi:hypothetical protein
METFQGSALASVLHILNLPYTHYIDFDAFRRWTQFKTSTVPHWCLPSRGARRGLQWLQQVADWEMEGWLKQSRYLSHVAPEATPLSCDKSLTRVERMGHGRPNGCKESLRSPTLLCEEKTHATDSHCSYCGRRRDPPTSMQQNWQCSENKETTVHSSASLNSVMEVAETT